MIKFLLLFLPIIFSISCTRDPVKRILLQPYEGFNVTHTESIKASLERNYGARMYVAPAIELPKHAFINVKSPRYRADTLLRYQRTIKPDSIDFILGLTASDISTTKTGRDGKVLSPESRYRDWGVFGLGYRPGSSSIISSYRLRSGNARLLTERLKKVANHEIGHNLGLEHCKTTAKCVMQDAAETIKTVDRVDVLLCEDCKRRI